MLELFGWSEHIAQKLSLLQTVIEAENIMCFVSFGSEVDTHGLIKKWILQGKNVSVPCLEKISAGSKVMHAVQIKSFSDLKNKGSYGILEPDLKVDSIVEPDSLDVIIVPGSIFDINRNRMGYGGGFYDRFLKLTAEKCKKIGVCYDFQVLEHIPHEDYDIPVDSIVTEKRTF
jgi:5-formyltetrahydrofolate cyclo-ligase